MGFFVSLAIAQDNGTGDYTLKLRELIYQFKNAPADKKYIYMNKIKLLIRQLEAEKRQKILQQVIHQIKENQRNQNREIPERHENYRDNNNTNREHNNRTKHSNENKPNKNREHQNHKSVENHHENINRFKNFDKDFTKPVLRNINFKGFMKNFDNHSYQCRNIGHKNFNKEKNRENRKFKGHINKKERKHEYKHKNFHREKERKNKDFRDFNRDIKKYKDKLLKKYRNYKKIDNVMRW